MRSVAADRAGSFSRSAELYSAVSQIFSLLGLWSISINGDHKHHSQSFLRLPVVIQRPARYQTASRHSQSVVVGVVGFGRVGRRSPDILDLEALAKEESRGTASAGNSSSRPRETKTAGGT